MMHISQERATAQPPLDVWLSQQPDACFPQHAGQRYPLRYEMVSEYLNHAVHRHVEKGALVQNDGYLTDHGPEHIKMVIRRAGELLGDPIESYPQLDAYGVYLLLMAAHFHDVGNLYGRKEHEKKTGPIMAELGKLAGTEMVEKKAIRQIASSHGGSFNGDKDTIHRLPKRDALLGVDVDFQAIAAILRFADELADDSSRAARALIELGVIPTKSEVFHTYSKSLQSVQVKPAQGLVILRFSFLKAAAIRKFGKGRRKVYLLDEIYERTLKMHFERQYCMRFMRDIVKIDAIDVKIEIYEDENSMTPCIDPIGYRLEEKGYPTSKDVKIAELCPDVTWDCRTLESQLR